MIKSSNNYPALQQSISGIYKIANKLFAGSLLFAGVTVSLLLFLWMNARKKEIAKQGASSQLGGGAEVDGFNKTLTSLEINISPKLMIYVVLFMSLVLIISLLISSYSSLKKSPRELLIDTK